MMPANEMPERWAIWIDIEGFSFLHEQKNPQSLLLLGRLVEDIFRVGRLVYPESPDRLFIHQMGDGFIIVSDFMEETPSRPIAIAVALMRSLLSYGGLARSGISSGDFADISGTLPQMLQDLLKDGGLPVGSGIMSINQVMGGALINAHRTAADGPRGPSLRIDSKFKEQIEQIEGLITANETGKSIEIDWLKSDIPLVHEIVKTIRGRVYSTDMLSVKLKEYIGRFDDTLPDEWRATATQLLI